MNLKKIQLGKLLLEKKLITPEQLDKAIEQQRKTGHWLGKVLVQLGFIKEDQLLKLISEQLNIPFIDLMNTNIDPAIAQSLPESLARRLQCIILKMDEQGYLVGMTDPLDVPSHDLLESTLKKPVSAALIRHADLLKAHDLIYRHAKEISSLAEELSVEIGKSDYDISNLTEGLSMADAPVVRLLQSIFEEAVQVNASDVHIEPDEKVVRIRQRIDGVLNEHVIKETNVAEALALRLKLMSGMNIAEKRLPQDGRFSIKIKNKNFDVRLSTLPSQFGESVVMRLLNQSGGLLNLDHVGMPAHILAEIRKIMGLPNGLFLLTGPTGSGKTTTLYSMLHELNTSDVKIITVEDPVEYRLPRITQVQVQPKIELDFARVLRAILRQDPDIIMIGELRDQETAEIALRAAMTGHFVFSTLHTNDAASAAERLLDMGTESYLVAAVLRGILSQRLVRRICQNCIVDYQPTPQEEAWVSSVPNFKAQGVTFKKGAGCPYCNHMGYRGQMGIYELLVMTGVLATALRERRIEEFHQLVVSDPHFKSLAQSGLDLAAQGITTIVEVMRVAIGESTA